MFRNPGHASIVLLFLAALSSDAAAGQSLAIRRNSKYETRIEANSAIGIGYRLQASGELQGWADFSDQASGPLSYRIDNTGKTNRFFRLRTWAAENAPITLVLIGDSTVADFVVNNSWFYGWGQGIYGYLKPNVRVVNLALAGNSTKVFLTSLEMQNMIRLKPDFVLIHFSLADTQWPDEESQVRTTTIPEYEANLKTIVQAIRDFKGTPILMTPANPRVFDDEKMVVPSMQDQCRVVKYVAAARQTYLIDLNQLSRNLFNELGETESAYISWSDKDRGHFSLKGAEVIAGLVINAFPNILRPHVVEIRSR